MALPDPGDPFPEIELQDEKGRPAALPEGETLCAFFKTTCPTSELTWPFLERIRVAGEGGRFTVVAVSQDEPGPTAEFNRKTGARIATLYDPSPWKASESLSLITVPALFLIGPDRVVRQHVLGFQKAKMEELAARAAALSGRTPAPLFRTDEAVPAIRPG